MSVEVSPAQLGFQRPLTQLVKRVLNITNSNQQPIAFKVKTTAPKQYCVRPNSGRIEPNQKVQISVLLQPMKEDPEPGLKCRDKFLVQSTFITPERESKPFTELWSWVEKEEKNSIFEHKIRCVYLPASSDDLINQSEYSSQKNSNHTHHSNLTNNSLNNRTNRDEDDDPRFNSINSAHPQSFHHSPLNQSNTDLPDTTNYDIALDDTFANRSTRNSATSPSLSIIKARAPSQSRLNNNNNNNNNIQKDEKLHQITNGRSPSIKSSNNDKKLIRTPSSSFPDEIHQLKSQLANALSEIERLKTSLLNRDESLRKRSNNSQIDHPKPIHSADMMDLPSHNLHGPEGLVPVQTVVLISIGVFVFTWLFF